MDLGTLVRGTRSFALGINNMGQVVGGAANESGEVWAFLYSKGIVTYLEELGWTDGVVYAINNAGQMVGFSNIDGEDHAFLYTLPRIPPRRP